MAAPRKSTARSTGTAVATSAGKFIGIDLGGTKIYGVVLQDRRVLTEAKRQTPATGVDAVVKTMADVIQDLGGTEGVVGIGVGAPGLVDGVAGTIHRAPNLEGFDQLVALASLVSSAVGGTPVFLDNDVRVAVRGEHALGAAEGQPDALGIWVGTGVGGGVVLDGRLRLGATGVAGEIGHTIVKPGGRRCGCGGRGHLEAYAGRGSMEIRARKLHATGHKTKLVELAGDARMTSGVWGKALEHGDKVAAKLVDGAVDALAVAIASAVTLLDVPLVVIGGGLGDRLGEPFVARIEVAAKKLVTNEGYPLRVVASTLQDRAGAVGAALLALTRLAR